VASSVHNLAKDAQVTAPSTCPAGTSIIGGGAAVNNPNLLIVASLPQTSPQRWAATVRSNTNNQTGTITVHAVCAIVQ
jgi:hypothetical protein